MSELKYYQLFEDVESINQIKSSSKIGHCREWARLTIIFIKSKFPTVNVSAREVDITPNLQHTFLRIKIEDEDPVLFDGTGTLKHEPYFGPEKDAPEHLKNSKSDIINRYL